MRTLTLVIATFALIALVCVLAVTLLGRNPTRGPVAGPRPTAPTVPSAPASGVAVAGGVRWSGPGGAVTVTFPAAPELGTEPSRTPWTATTATAFAGSNALYVTVLGPVSAAGPMGDPDDVLRGAEDGFRERAPDGTVERTTFAGRPSVHTVDRSGTARVSLYTFVAGDYVVSVGTVGGDSAVTDAFLASVEVP